MWQRSTLVTLAIRQLDASARVLYKVLPLTIMIRFKQQPRVFGLRCLVRLALLCLLMCQRCCFQWISLGELLGRCGRRLTVDELWALCYTCLSSLQSYIDFPGDCGAPAHQPPVAHAADFCLVR